MQASPTLCQSTTDCTSLQHCIATYLKSPQAAKCISCLQWTTLGNELLISENIMGIPHLWEFVKDVFRSPDFEKHNTISRAVLVRHIDERALQSFLYRHEQECKSNPAIRRNLLEFANADGVAAHAMFRSLCVNGHLTLAWHGFNNTNNSAFFICRDGLRGTSDAYFGTGSYLTPEVAYAAKYSDFGDDDECAVILFAVSATQVYPVTVEKDYRTPHEEELVEENVRGFSKYFSRDPDCPIALKPFSNAHFIPVKEYGNIHPRNKNENLRYDVHYQATSESDAEFHELVVASHHQVHPIAIVYFKKTVSQCCSDAPS